MDDQLYAVIRGVRVKPGMATEFARRVETGALPLMKKIDGFKGIHLVASQDNILTIVSFFSNRTVAEASTQTLMPWLAENLDPLLASQPVAADGIVLLSG
jgi:hypothetical protein